MFYLGTGACWMFVYPLYRFDVEFTTELNKGKIHLVKFDDVDFWSKYTSKFNDAKYFEWAKGRFNYPYSSCGERNRIPWFPEKATAWIVCFAYGDRTQAMEYVLSQLKQFVSLLFCCLYQELGPNVLLHSCSDPVHEIGLFGTESGSGFSCNATDFAMPPYLGELSISSAMCSKINDWYDNLNKTKSRKMRNRVNVGIRFCYYALMNNDSLMRYIFYSFLMDALFGIKNQSQKSFTQGIVSTMSKGLSNDGCQIKQAALLYDLRCAIVHGDTSNIADWEKFTTYIQTYDSEPLNDLIDIAFRALYNYFGLASAHFYNMSLYSDNEVENT